MVTADSVLKGRRVLILGGLGFIGSNLAIRLVSLGAKVVVVDSMLPRYGGNLLNIEPVKDDIDINFSDIRDIYSLEYLVKGAEYIFSMAGQTGHLLSMTDPFTDLDVNCRAQLSILECCRKFNREVTILNASTRQVYGKPQRLPVSEDHPLVPSDVNGINKIASEHYYTLYSKLYGIRCVSLRLTNTYGPRQQLRGNEQGFTGIFSATPSPATASTSSATAPRSATSITSTTWWTPSSWRRRTRGSRPMSTTSARRRSTPCWIS